MKRIFLFLSILLCSLSMTAQSAWLFNRGDSISWQPTQDMTITFEKDPSGFFWQNIQTSNLDIVRMPIETGDGITFADTPFLQVEKKYFEVTNEGDHRFEVHLKTNISDWNTITCQPQADWLRLVDTNGSQFPVITYTFEYDANYTGELREVQITFSHYELSDNVNVLSIGETATFEVLPKEITVTNSQDPRQFTVTLSSNVSEVLYGCTYKIVGDDAEWLRCVSSEGNETGNSFMFEYDLNYTGQDREALLVFKNEQYNKTNTVKVVSVGENMVSCANVYLGRSDGDPIVVAPPSGGIIEIPIVGSTEIKVKIECISNMRQLSDTIKNGVLYVRFEVSEVEEDVKDCWIRYYAENTDDDWGNDFLFYQPNKNAPSLEKIKVALVALYYATDGENWHDNTNWLSDKPLSQWYGVNNSRMKPGSYVIGDYVYFVDLRDNNLYGELPPTFSTLMEVPELNIDVNYLYGNIPNSVLQHPNWSLLAWNIIKQDEICHGKPMTCDNYNLSVTDEEIELFVDETKSSISDILKENELTLVFNYGTVAEIADLTDERVNLYLDYCNKGLGMVVQIDDWWEGDGWLPYDGYRDHIRNKQSTEKLPKGIKWVRSANNFGNIDLSIFGSMCLLDKNGNLVGYWMKHGEDLRAFEYYYNQKIDSILRSRLGNPEEHEKYSTLYTSTDYSEDGRVIKLQEATEGSGIDLVFVGECFVDTDMGEYGLYEKTMQDAMEQFFTEEPYTSLRNRFNV